MGTGDYAVWGITLILEVYILVRAILYKDFLRYLSLNLFVAAMVVRDVSGFWVIREYGFSSPQYTFVYYYTDAILTILMFLTIMHLYYQVFREMHVGKYVRVGTFALLAGTALFAYGVVQSNTDHLTSRFVIEMSQDLYFVGVVLTYLLWAAVFKLRETRARLVQLVLALGIYFSGAAAVYALRNMFPSVHQLAAFAGTLLGGVLLPAAWAYTFTRTPEDARLVPARLAEGMVPHR